MGGTVAVEIIAIIIALAFGFAHYNADIYPADQAKEWLWRARATNDLNDMAKYLQNSLDKLDASNGNPKWIYPTPDTDYDLIKNNIQEIITNCRAWSGTNQTAQGYQQAVQNLQETIKEIAEHLEGANGWALGSPAMWFLGTVWLWIWIPTLFMGEDAIEIRRRYR